MIVGIVSDTHGVLPPFVCRAFSAAGVSHILHAGDVGHHGVLDGLRAVAPVTWVRGNTDARTMGPLSEVVSLGGRTWYLLHDETALDLCLETAGIDVLVCGHTHRPLADRRKATWHLNPGSASFPRGGHPASVLIVHLTDTDIVPRFVSASESATDTTQGAVRF